MGELCAATEHATFNNDHNDNNCAEDCGAQVLSYAVQSGQGRAHPREPPSKVRTARRQALVPTRQSKSRGQGPCVHVYMSARAEGGWQNYVIDLVFGVQ